MASLFPDSSTELDIYQNTKLAIDESLKQFSDFSKLIEEVCNQARLIGRSLQSLEDVIVPEIIGQKQVRKVSSRKFKNDALLMDSLDTFSMIMMSYSEKIKNEATDLFNDFIVQAVLPSDDEVKGIQEHNSQIVNDFRDSFFSLYNHFMVLAAELMEKFLICGDCSTPIGFPHQPLCLNKSMSTPNVWKKVNFDDKFITFGMNFCFNDLLIPNGRMDILSKIASCCMKQAQEHEKTSLPLVTNSWPDRWILGNKSKKKNKEHKSIKTVRVGHKTHPINKPSIGKPSSIWTPTTSDSLPLNHQNEGFTLRHDDFN